MIPLRLRGSHRAVYTMLFAPAFAVMASGVFAAPVTTPAATAVPKPVVTWPQPDVDRVVTDAAGKPIVGAKVTWYSLTVDERQTDPTAIPMIVLATAVTDNKGRFHFDGKTIWAASSFGEASVQADGIGATGQVVSAISGRVPLKDGPIVASPPTSLVVKLVDAQGKPAAGVKIRPVILLKEEQIYVMPPGAATLTTSAQGIVTFDGLPQGFDVTLAIDDDRFAQIDMEKSRIHLAAAPRTDAPDIHVIAGATISGTVTYGAAGKPAAGIRVSANQSPYRGMPGGTAVTDAAGRFTIARIAGGSYALTARPQPGASNPWVSPTVSAVVPAAGRQAGIKIALVKGAKITGHAAYAGTHKPAAGVGITLHGPSGSVPADMTFVTTDAAGNFTASVLPGTVYVSPQVPNPGAEIVVKASAAAPAMVAVEVPEPIPPLVVTGTVLDAAGNPAPNAEILASSPSYMSAPSCHSGEDGKFTLTMASTNMVFLRARKGTSITASDNAALSGDSVTLRLADGVGGSVTGSVTDSGGQPISGANVSIYSRSNQGGPGIPAVTTAADGAFSFSGLFPDVRYGVMVTMKGYGRGNVDDIVLRRGETFAAPKLVLPDANSFVAGHVVDSRGTPLTGAEVMCTEIEGAQVVTDKNGKFRLNGVPPGKVILQVRAKDEFASVQEPTGKDNVLIQTYSESAMTTQQATRPKPETFVGKQAPEFSGVKWVNTSPIALSDLHGKYIVFDMWGCCVDNLFETQRIMQQFGPRGVVAIGMNVSGSKLEEVQGQIAKEHLLLPVGMDTGDSMGKGLGTNGFEAYALVDREGKIAYTGWDHNELLQTLGKRLAEEQAALKK